MLPKIKIFTIIFLLNFFIIPLLTITTAVITNKSIKKLIYEITPEIKTNKNSIFITSKINKNYDTFLSLKIADISYKNKDSYFFIKTKINNGKFKQIIIRKKIRNDFYYIIDSFLFYFLYKFNLMDNVQNINTEIIKSADVRKTANIINNNQANIKNIKANNKNKGNKQNNSVKNLNNNTQNTTNDNTQSNLKRNLKDNAQNTKNDKTQSNLKRNLKDNAQNTTNDNTQSNLKRNSKDNAQNTTNDNTQSNLKTNLKDNAQKNLKTNSKDNNQNKNLKTNLKDNAQTSLKTNSKDNPQNINTIKAVSKKTNLDIILDKTDAQNNLCIDNTKNKATYIKKTNIRKTKPKKTIRNTDYTVFCEIPKSAHILEATFIIIKKNLLFKRFWIEHKSIIQLFICIVCISLYFLITIVIFYIYFFKKLPDNESLIELNSKNYVKHDCDDSFDQSEDAEINEE